MNDSDRTGDARHRWVDPRTIRAARLFAEEPGAPRTRRPTDIVLAVAALATLAMASWAAEPPGSLSAGLMQLAADSPDWLGSVWQICFDTLWIWSAVVFVLALIRRHWVVAASMVAAAALGVMVAFVSNRFAVSETGGFSEFVESLTSSSGPPEFPGIRMVAATAVVIVASPSLSRPFRFFGRVLLALGFVASVGLEVATLVGVIGGVAAGALAAATVHLVAGSPGGRPNPDTVRMTLAELGVPVNEITPALIQPAGVVLMEATGADGRRLDVKVYGRDAWDGQLITKLWRWAWYRDGRSELLLSRMHQVEHEALMTVLAGRAGATVPDVVTAGLAFDGDAALVSTAGGTSLATFADEDGDVHTTLDRLWTMMRLLHDRGIVHGGIDLDRVTVDENGAPMLVDWVSASVAAPAPAVLSEQAQLLVLAALLIGPERAVSTAVGHLGQDVLGGVVAYLQIPALTVGLRREIRERDFDLDALRTLVAARSDMDEVELVKLRRVSIGGVLSVALLVFAAWLLVSAVLDIGVSTLIDELSSAALGWVLLALIVAQVARFWNAVGTTGATNKPLPLGPLTVLEFAITFVNLVVPSSAGRIATKMRFFQKVGLTLTAAAAMGALDSLAGFVVQVVILLAALLFGVGGIEFNVDLDTAEVQRLAVLVAATAVVITAVAAVVALLVPTVRERIAMVWHQVTATLRVVRSPDRMLRLMGGNLAAEITFAMVLGLSLRAYGTSAPLMSLIVVNVAVALLAGLMPVPGGIGVSEAATTAGLVAIGVPQATAVAAAITTRLCTFYLPPIWGYVAMRWLRKNQYL